MDKIFGSPEESIADLADGASIAVTGFGTSYGFPVSLLVATKDKGIKNLCLVSNGLGAVGQLRSMMLIANKQVSRLIVSFSWRPGPRTPADDQIEDGELEVELVPQGILVERMRAGGAGIPAFYSPTGIGTSVAEGKEVRYFDGKPHILETAINVDYAFVRGYRADRLGNVELKGSNRNFTPAFAKAARCTIVEVDEICEVGEIDPENVGLPGIFVNRVVKATVEADEVRPASRRPGNKPREYNGKPGWTRDEMARRIAVCSKRAPTSILASECPRSSRTTLLTATSSCTVRMASSATARWLTAMLSTATSSMPPASTCRSCPAQPTLTASRRSRWRGPGACIPLCSAPIRSIRKATWPITA